MDDSKLPAAKPTTDDADSPTKKKVKPVLKKHPVDGTDGGRPKKELKWDEEIIEEHDQLRGTRMKVRRLRIVMNESTSSLLEEGVMT